MPDTTITISRTRWSDNSATHGGFVHDERDAVTARVAVDTGAHDLVETFAGLMITFGFHAATVADAMGDYAAEARSREGEG